MTTATITAGRWELLRALGAVPDSPAAARCVGAALGLDPVSDAEHTGAFVLNCPPYAAIYLGPQGAIGGEGADRVAGFWRAIGITPPTEPATMALGRVREVYGVRRVEFNEADKTVRVEYDATRLTEPIIHQLLRRSGLDVIERVSLIPPQPPPPEPAAASTAS